MSGNSLNNCGICVTLRMGFDLNGCTVAGPLSVGPPQSIGREIRRKEYRQASVREPGVTVHLVESGAVPAPGMIGDEMAEWQTGGVTFGDSSWKNRRPSWSAFPTG
ncbi:uncharacterized protein CLUP02_02410 [Colletotrichum lupini]|uniref:Uncharacterized protein n=1 Tax=Colletotrichum lupini TaxID=145971 RepID=A0A9Q8WB90_9PEZI|nr:uncharacterized protein CLUP02_02410 [Colletotrichum lupini]UQC76944.1 hypothetical protein CLUP02_02410 [Colletotrichum lupini]